MLQLSNSTAEMIYLHQTNNLALVKLLMVMVQIKTMLQDQQAHYHTKLDSI